MQGMIALYHNVIFYPFLYYSLSTDFSFYLVLFCGLLFKLTNILHNLLSHLPEGSIFGCLLSKSLSGPCKHMVKVESLPTNNCCKLTGSVLHVALNIVNKVCSITICSNFMSRVLYNRLCA